MRILNVVGARPNFMKMAPLVRSLERRGIAQTLLHNGQHYDDNMSRVFFDELGMPEPDVHLEVGSGSHAQQTAQIMLAIEDLFRERCPDLVLVAGDVNSTAATALVTAKEQIPLGHVEAGLRSYDRTMPEEINRVVVDHLSDLLFTTEESAERNLRREGIDEERIFFVGAGSAGIGLANLMVREMIAEGLHEEVARSRIAMFDENGLLEASRRDLFDFQRPYAHAHAPTRNLLEAIQSLKPTTLIGVSTVGRLFTKDIVEEMARLNERPVIFALSNPTDHAECTAEEAYKWSEGRAIYAAGVPFPPVHLDGKVFLPGQANNLYIFPAVAMAIYAAKAKRVTDDMFIEAARGVADQVPPALLAQGALFPPQADILETSIKTAARVLKTVFDNGLARVERPSDLEAYVRSQVYRPEYGQQKRGA